jgi:hypothetical protein
MQQLILGTGTAIWLLTEPHWVFLLYVTGDTVTLTNFVKNFNLCGRLLYNSLVAKPLSALFCNSCSNFQQSND